MVYVTIGLFSVLGALLRDVIGQWTTLWWEGSFPVATFSINILGCFFLGWFSGHLKKLERIPPTIKTGVSTGFIGSFTTFSTFSVETAHLFTNGHVLLAMIYLLLSYVGGFLCVFLGTKFGDWMMRNRRRVVK